MVLVPTNTTLSIKIPLQTSDCILEMLQKENMLGGIYGK